ncbi:MAG: sec-independent protein translocase protein TatA [Acidobacteriota bacterium]|jgi:TatA/E family protein of Tat protein translocase
MTRYNSLSPKEPDSYRHSHSGEVYSDCNLTEGKRPVFFALILDSLGSTELVFILVIALIFFGPRKLPQLAKSMGKGLAEFRKASDDFKRTWEREVALETTRAEDNSLLESQPTPVYEPAPSAELVTGTSDLVVARETQSQTFSEALAEIPPEPIEIPAEAAQAEAQPVRKQDWL